MQTGNVPWPDCLSTFGLLGAESSFSIAHFAAPLPVCVAVQPGGGAPVFISSKLTVSAMASPVAILIAIIVKLKVFIVPLLILVLRQRRAHARQSTNHNPTSNSPGHVLNS